MANAMRELKEQKIWFCFNKELKNGKLTKVPCSASGHATGTDQAHSHTWVTFDEAMAAAASKRYSGVGFVIPEGYFFIDIDHRTITDVFVQMLLTRFDSYAEYSVSGEGIHIYGKCDIAKLPTYLDAKGKIRLDKQFYMKNASNDLELYIGGLTNRFAVFTENIIEDKPLRDCTAAVLTTLDKNMRKKAKTNYSPKRDGDREPFDIIANLRKQKNGDKFSKLFDAGDKSDYVSAQGEIDDSRADAALCALIAFRTGNDPELIDTLFRQSALYREKWERDDYRAGTIAAGVEACQGQFHFSVVPKPDFVKYDAKSDMEYISCPLLARHVRENLSYLFVRDNGRQGVLRYVYENGCYRAYADEMLKGIIKTYIAAYDEELVQMGKVGEVFQQLATDLNFVSQDELDNDEDLINFENGLLRLSDMTLLPHTPETLSTIQIPCQWTGVPKPTPVYDRYIHTLTDGDLALVKLLYEFKGACISNVKGWRMKKALFLVGPGDTGKSIEKSLTESLIGKGNFVGIDLAEIEARFGTGNIYGKRLAGSSDMSFVTVSELKTFKKCTGGDSLFAEFKGMNGFEFTYKGLLWFCMNRLPKFGGDDGKWVYDRIMQVECKNVIPLEKQDKQLLTKLYAEREGIVFKSVMALKQVIANGYRFTEPSTVTKARENYRVTNSTVTSFYNECTMERPEQEIKDGCTTGKVYRVYKAWCQDNNNGYAKTARDFRNELAAHLGTTFDEMTVRRKNGTFYKAFTLNLESKEQYPQAYGYDSTEFLA